MVQEMRASSVSSGHDVADFGGFLSVEGELACGVEVAPPVGFRFVGIVGAEEFDEMLVGADQLLVVATGPSRPGSHRPAAVSYDTKYTTSVRLTAGCGVDQRERRAQPAEGTAVHSPIS